MKMVFDPFDEEFFKRFFRQLKDFDKEVEEMEKKFRLDFRRFERTPGVAGFKIEIRDFGKGKPEVRVTRIGGPPAKVAPAVPEKVTELERPEPTEKPREIKPISQMLETNVGKIERLDEVVLTMQVPGVRKEDLELRPLGNTLEVIARKPSGEAFFAAFELPHDASPDKRQVELKGNMLIISIPRRRKPPTGVR
jgi:HSP20 family molecular chaperone IbpA